MISNRTSSGSVSEPKDLDKHAKKYTDVGSGGSPDSPAATTEPVIVRQLAQVKVMGGRLTVTGRLTATKK